MPPERRRPGGADSDRRELIGNRDRVRNPADARPGRRPRSGRTRSSRASARSSSAAAARWDRHDVWGRRKLAYEIDHKPEGFYHLLTVLERAGDAGRDLAHPADHRRRHAAHGRAPAKTARGTTGRPAEAAGPRSRRAAQPEAAPEAESSAPRSPSRSPKSSRKPASIARTHVLGREHNGSQHQPRRPRRQPDARPRAAAHAERNRRLQPAHRGEHAPEGRRDRRVEREAELLRRHRLGQPGRELRAVPVQGPPRRRRRPPRLARVGGPGRNEAPGGRDHRRLRPVPRRPRRRRGRRRAAVRARRRGAPRRRRLRPGGAADDDIPF